MVTNCSKCNSDRIVNLMAKCSDLCSISYKDLRYHGYVPYDIGIGNGDYVEFNYCADCGQIQGDFPIQEDVLTKDL